jgi:hypothetical protein
MTSVEGPKLPVYDLTTDPQVFVEGGQVNHQALQAMVNTVLGTHFPAAPKQPQDR